MDMLERIISEAIAEAKPATSKVPAGLLDRLAQVESGGNPRAVSSAGALGMYQFMPGTARELGINPMDPTQARAGAERYLKQMYDKFGNWRHAAMAYHAGPGNVSKWLRGERSGVGPKTLRYPGLLGL